MSQRSYSRAAVMTKLNAPLEVQSFPLPEVDPSSMLVRVTTATVCGTDVHRMKGETRSPSPLPLVMGHEGVGVVHELGAGVRTDFAGQKVSKGDRVVWSYARSCGKCYSCSVRGSPQNCPQREALGINIPANVPPHLNGNFAEYVYVRGGTPFFRVPEEMEDEVASPASCALATVMNGFEKLRFGPDDMVVIQGAGALGLYATALSKELGAPKVLVTDLVDSRLEMAREFGADVTMKVTAHDDPEERIAAVRGHTFGSYGADHVIEATGSPEAVGEGYRYLASGGTYLLLGSVVSGEATVTPASVIRNQVSIVGSFASGPRHLRRAVRFLQSRQGVYPFPKMVGHRFRLQDVNQALEAASKRETVKVAIDPQG